MYILKFLSFKTNGRVKMSLKTIKNNIAVLLIINVLWIYFSINFIHFYEFDSIFERKVKSIILFLIILVNTGDILLKFIKLKKFVDKNREYYSNSIFIEPLYSSKYIVIFIITFVSSFFVSFIANCYSTFLFNMILLVFKK